MKYTFWNNTTFDYLIALVIFLVALAILRIFKYVIIKKLKKLAKKTKNDLDDMVMEAVEKVFVPPFYAFISLYISLQYLTLTETVGLYLYYFLVFIGTFYGIKFVTTFIDYTTRKFLEKEEKREKKKVDKSVIKLLSSFAKAFMWVIAALLILSNLGYNINTLIAGLGIGGLAIAFALQNVLSDIFASFSIYFDKPFETGDYIVIGSDSGTVKKIGIKSTRIQTLQGEELVVSNRELTETRIHNYKKMKKRRGKFSFGVEYGTPTKKLKKIPEIVKGAVNGVKLAELDRVHFTEFGDFSLNFEVVYYVNSKDYAKYRDIQQEINLKIKEIFEKEKINMAFPTQTVFLKK
ncbi:MAG: mechanosensitive ion channel family protein [Candidatus Aenigmarchaeota archaeon]|nr:mechanosensitive ion channel family protein [Candidatus Aenigmarchaeota archaeon]